MKPLTIYLAGAMSCCSSFEEMNAWREYANEKLQDASNITGYPVKIINPVSYYNFEELKHQNEREIMQFDLNKVKSSDLIIVNIEGLNTSIGTAIELYEAYKRDIPVIAYNPNGKFDYSKIHHWLQCYVTRVEDNMFKLADYISEFYMR